MEYSTTNILLEFLSLGSFIFTEYLLMGKLLRNLSKVAGSKPIFSTSL